MRGVFIILPVALMGCADLPLLDRLPGRGDPPADASVTPQPRPATVTNPLTGPATTAVSLDTVSEAEKVQARRAAAAAPADGDLGKVTVSLGSPSEGGLWVKTALVSEDTPGTVRTSDGDAIAVTLRPLGGTGGAQISLSALRALGLPLAGLFPVTLARAG